MGKEDIDGIFAVEDSTEDGEDDSTEDNDGVSAIRDSTEDGEYPLQKIVVNYCIAHISLPTASTCCMY